MRTFDLPSIWFKTVEGTPLREYNWDEIALVLSEQGLITLVAPPGANGFTRYKLNHEKLNCSREETRGVILKVLAEHLPARFGVRK
jgi:hypothetical protein